MTGKQYLASHGINKETAELFSITYDENFLYIPIKTKIDGEETLAFTKQRNLKFIPKEERDENTPDECKVKYKNSQGSHAILFNQEALEGTGYVFITEGEIDCIRLVQEGIRAVSSTGGAGTFSEDWASLFEGKNVFICFDSDDAGDKGVRHVLSLLPKARVIKLPAGYKDICDYLLEHTREEFVELRKTAQTKEEYEESTMPEDFSVISAKELSEMEFTEEPWLIENILYSEGFCFLYGSEGTGKSFLTLSIAKAVASGASWLGKFKTNKGNVLLLDKENPLSMTHRRAKGLSLSEDNIYWLKYPEKFALTDSKGELSEFARAISAIVTNKEIDLIIVDSFVDLMVGNESSAEDTQSFFTALRALFPKKAFLVLHHENKPSQGLFRTDSQRLRGSSNINAQTFTQFRLEPVAKSKTEITLKQTKARDAQKLDKFMVRMVVERLTDGKTQVTGFEYMGTVEEGIEEDTTKLGEIETLISEIVTEKAFVSKANLIEMGIARGASEKTVSRTIKKMLEDGALVTTKKGKEKYYSIGLLLKRDEPEDIWNNDID